MLIKIVGAIATVVIIAVIVVGLAMWRGLIPVPSPLLALLVGAQEPEYSARYYPSDTLAYGWVTLTPAGGQFEEMHDIWDRFNEYRTFTDLIDELRDEFEDDTGIDFEMEVMPWIGPEIAAAVIEVKLSDGGIGFDDGVEAWEGRVCGGHGGSAQRGRCRRIFVEMAGVYGARNGREFPLRLPWRL